MVIGTIYWFLLPRFCPFLSTITWINECCGRIFVALWLPEWIYFRWMHGLFVAALWACFTHVLMHSMVLPPTNCPMWKTIQASWTFEKRAMLRIWNWQRNVTLVDNLNIAHLLSIRLEFVRSFLLINFLKSVFVTIWFMLKLHKKGKMGEALSPSVVHAEILWKWQESWSNLLFGIAKVSDHIFSLLLDLIFAIWSILSMLL